MPKVPPKKWDRNLIRELIIEEELTDKQIAEKIGAAKRTIQIIRTKELKIKKKQKTWKSLEWYQKYFGGRVYIPKIIFEKLKIKYKEPIYYRISYELPRKVILDFRRIDEIDKRNTRKRRSDVGRRHKRTVVVGPSGA